MAEAARLGMERMLISGHGSHPTPPKGLTVVPVKRVNEVAVLTPPPNLPIREILMIIFNISLFFISFILKI